MENNEKLFEITFAMMKEQKRKLMLDNFIYLNDNLYEERGLVEDDELTKAKELMPFKFMFFMTIICVKGKFRVNVNLMDMELEENDALVITPGSIINKVETEPGTKLLMMAFANNNDSNLKELVSPSTRKFFLHSAMFQGNKEDMEEVKGIYKQMRMILQHKQTEYTREKLQNCLKGLELLFMAQKEKFQKEQMYKKPSRQEEILLDFMQEVHDHCQEHRDLKYFADRLCLSPSYLAHVISETSGKHASEWIKEAVILEAKTMLRKSSYTIQQVSLALNFPNQSFFGKYFKAAVGISPKQYQQR